MNITQHPQREFETEVARIFKIDDYLVERGSSDPMIIDDLDTDEHFLAGTKGYSRNGDVILIATKDSETNHIECITLDMIKMIVARYCHHSRKAILATNLPIEIHSSKVKDLEKDHKLFIKKIGYSFCMRHNLKFREVY